METIEIEGKTIDEAIQKACTEFQVPREKLNIEIIAEGNPGFLGLGAKKALIRASRLSIDMSLDAIFAQKSPSSAARARKSSASTPRTRSAGSAARTAATRQTVKAAPQESPKYTATAKTGSEPVGSSERSAEKAKRLLEGILMRMKISSPVDMEETDDAIILNIQGDGSGLLIGKRGQNLDAIQYIVNKAVHQSANGDKRIIIDTEEYRKRREESLIALAKRLGDKVKKTNKPLTVGHMNAHDRRIIHMAMQNDETLTTKSRGEGEYRKIVILPAKRGQNNTGV